MICNISYGEEEMHAGFMCFYVLFFNMLLCDTWQHFQPLNF